MVAPEYKRSRIYHGEYVDVVTMQSLRRGSWKLTSDNWNGTAVVVKRSGESLKWFVDMNVYFLNTEFRTLKDAAAAASELYYGGKR